MKPAADLLRAALSQLREAGIEDAGRDARLLLAHAMGLPADRLTLHLPDKVDRDCEARLDRLVQARRARQPISQIIGERLFWGRSFQVTPDVLDPRPETEVLVAAALDEGFRRVLDLGTGTGCILLTLLLERPEASGIGVELSPAALAVAEANRVRHGIDSAEMRPGSWFAPLAGEVFDLIVSNPPYIAATEMAGLAVEVRDHEPHLALTPGGDGLDAYRAIAAGAAAHLTAGGRLIVEIGPTQAAAVSGFFSAAGLTDITIRRDLDGRDRVVLARKPQVSAS